MKLCRRCCASAFALSTAALFSRGWDPWKTKEKLHHLNIHISINGSIPATYGALLCYGEDTSKRGTEKNCFNFLSTEGSSKS